MTEVAPLYTDQSPLAGTMPLLPPDTRSAPFWSSRPRPIDSTVTEVCEVTLHGPRLVNYIRASVPHFPHELRLEYWNDDLEAWTAVRDSAQQQVLNRVFDSKPSRITPSTFQSGVQHPMHQGNNHWIDLSWKVPAITAQRWRFLLKRIPGIGPIDASTGRLLDFPLGLQDIDLGYRVYSEEDIPAGAVESPGFASSLDYLGSRVEYGVRRLEASQALTTAGIGWRSEPQPVQYGVVNYYMDVRDSIGRPQIIDRFFLDPLTPGVHCNLYYTTDAPAVIEATTWTIAQEDYSGDPNNPYVALPTGFWKMIGTFVPSQDNVTISPPTRPDWAVDDGDELDYLLYPLTASPGNYHSWGVVDSWGYQNTPTPGDWSNRDDYVTDATAEAGDGGAYAVFLYVWRSDSTLGPGVVVDAVPFIDQLAAQGTFTSLLSHRTELIESDYEAFEWTSIPRDYILARGFMNLPPTKAAAFKFEFTNLIAEHYEVFVPITRTVKLFRADTVAAYEKIAKSDSTGPTAGFRAQRALSVYQRYRDALDLLTAGQAAYPLSPTLALTANNDPDLAARLRRTGWVWNFDPWHIGLGAPRFTKTQVHVYDEAEVSHVSRIGYFVGLKLVQPYKADPLANEDTPQYDFHFNLTAGEAAGVVSSTNGINYDGTVAVFESAAAQIESQTLNSQRGVRALQYATVQSPPAQIMPDPNLLQPVLNWGTWGDAAANALPTGGIHVQRGFATTFYGNLDDRLYSDIEALGLYGNVEGGATPTGQFGGGIESIVLTPSALGHITVVATVTTDDVLTGPLTLQIVSDNNIVLASTDFWLSQGETVKAKASYDLGTAAPAQPYSALEDMGNYGNLESSTYGELEGTPVLGSIKVRVIQVGADRNEFNVLRVGVFDDPLVWEFSNDGGLTWWAAPGIKNDPYGVLPFPAGINSLIEYDEPISEDWIGGPDPSQWASPTQYVADYAYRFSWPGGDITLPVPPKPPAHNSGSSVTAYIVTDQRMDQAFYSLVSGPPEDPLTYGDWPTNPYGFSYHATADDVTYENSGPVTFNLPAGNYFFWRGVFTNDPKPGYDITPNPYPFPVIAGAVWIDHEIQQRQVQSSATMYGTKLRWRVRGFQEGAWLSALAIRPWYVGVNGPMASDYGSIIGPNRTPLDHYGPIDNDPMWRAQNNVIDAFLDEALGGQGSVGPLVPAGQEPTAHSADVFENLPTYDAVDVLINGRPVGIVTDAEEFVATSDLASAVVNHVRTAADSAISTPRISDGFNRPNGPLGTTPDGTVWQQTHDYSGNDNFQISGGRIVAVGIGYGGESYGSYSNAAWFDTGNAYGIFQATFSTVTSPNNQSAMLLFLHDIGNFVLVGANGGVIQRINSSFVDLSGSQGQYWGVAAPGDVMTFVCKGNSFDIYKNGVYQNTYTLDAGTIGTGFGVGVDGGEYAQAQWDDVSWTDYTFDRPSTTTIPGPVGPPPTYVASAGPPPTAYDSFNGWTTFTYTPPAGTQVGDLLVIQQAWWTYTGQQMTGPAGWTAIPPNNGGYGFGQDLQQMLFCKIADASDAAGTSSYVTIDHTGGGADTVRSGGMMHAFRGVDTRDLTSLVFAGGGDRYNSPNTFTPDFASVGRAALANSRIFYFTAISDPNQTYVLDSALTQDGVWQLSAANSQYDELILADEVQASWGIPTGRSVQAPYGEGLSVVAVALPPAPTKTFAYNGTNGTDGTYQTYTVPANTTALMVDAYGAEGGRDWAFPGDTFGGQGGEMKALIPVQPGEVLRIYVGGYVGAQGQAGGWNGGGNTGSASDNAEGGGGATDIRRAPYTLNDRLVVAGGGGGSGSGYSAGQSGGHGGGLVGGAGRDSYGGGGQGGTQTAGGAGGTGSGFGGPGNPGTFGVGGDGAPLTGSGQGNGGGGGGWYGGGGGGAQGAGGGGGSSYVTPIGLIAVNAQGGKFGHGAMTVQAVGAPAMTITESFTHPDNTDLVGQPTTDGKAVWRKMTTGFYNGQAPYLGLVTYSNRLYCNQIDTYSDVIETESPDGIMQMTIDSVANNGTYGTIGFTARYNPQTGTMLQALWQGPGGSSGGRFTIFEWHGDANPVGFDVTPYPPPAGTLAAGDVFAFRFRGTLCELLQNGVVVASGTCSYIAGTQHGPAMAGSSNASIGQNNSADDFVFTAL